MRCRWPNACMYGWCEWYCSQVYWCFVFRTCEWVLCCELSMVSSSKIKKSASFAGSTTATRYVSYQFNEAAEIELYLCWDNDFCLAYCDLARTRLNDLRWFSNWLCRIDIFTEHEHEKTLFLFSSIDFMAFRWIQADFLKLTWIWFVGSQYVHKSM